MIECEDPEPNVKHDARVREMYLVVMKKFLQVYSLKEKGESLFGFSGWILIIPCGLGLSQRW